jgi:endonuclease III
MKTGPTGHARNGRVPSPAVVARVMRTLAQTIDGMELPAIEKLSAAHREDPFKILIGTLLSARTQDATTHAASTRLFRAAGTPERVAALPVKRIERLIYPVSFYRNKARYVKATSREIVAHHGGRVPDTLEGLVSLPGVGRKTANLVMILAFAGKKNICVDTHVHRISNRLGWVRTDDPLATEMALYTATAPRWWPLINLYLVTWGQYVCRPLSPRCEACAIAVDCRRVGVLGR